MQFLTLPITKHRLVSSRIDLPVSRVPHVAVLIETSRSYGRALLRGVRQYIAEHGPWSVFMELRALESQAPPWLKNWAGDGVLTRTGSQAMANALLRAGLPTVELRATKIRHPFPFVGVDNAAVGRLVAEHLLDRGFRHFAVYELETEDYFEQRRDSFVATVSERGYSCATFRPRGRREKPAEWERAQNELSAWVSSLPRPVGVLACTDQMGFWLLDACRRAGVSVPEDVAVGGVENDESLCETATPPLSSLALNGELVGYTAARILDQLMRGEEPDDVPPIAPLGVVTRHSSDVVAVDDPDLSRALRFIREHACEGIRVNDVLAAVPLSRSTLERKTRELLGRSPNQEILRVKLNRARTLLQETDLTLEQIARRSGFPHVPYLCEAFKREFDVPPGTYRRTVRT